MMRIATETVFVPKATRDHVTSENKKEVPRSQIMVRAELYINISYQK